MRANIRDESTIIKLTEYLMSEVGNTINPNKIANTLRYNQVRISLPTVNNYLTLLTRAYIFYRAEKYDLRGKKYLQGKDKYYTVDTGLRDTFINKSGRDNFGNQLENIVYLELLRRGYRVTIGDYEGSKIDFVARKSGEVVYYQVTQRLPDNSTRETDNLRYIPDGYKKVVLTLNMFDAGRR